MIKRSDIMRGSVTMALRGAAGGTLRMEGREGVLALRGRHAAPARAYFVCEDGSVSGSGFSPDMRCELPAGRICAAAVFDAEARLICRGTLGVCGRKAEGRLGELRMRAVSELRPPAFAPETRAAKAEGAEAGSPASPVTEEILARARGLFSSASGSAPPEPPPEPPPVIEAVRNPFPRSYPNSYWQRTEGESRIVGTAETPRGRIILRALPGSRSRRPLGYERYLIGADGRGWWVHEGK